MSAFLVRYRGQTRVHTESDLRIFLRWRTDHLDPLTAARADVERYVRWLQDVRRYQPSTVSRRPTTFAVPPCQPNRRPSGWDTCGSRH